MFYPKQSEICSLEENLDNIKREIDKINMEREKFSKLVSEINKSFYIIDNLEIDELTKENLKLLFQVIKFMLKDKIHESKPNDLLIKKYNLQKNIELKNSLRKVIDMIFERLL